MFPYRPRRFQTEVMKFVEKGIGSVSCIHAPTGFGKTPVILAKTLEAGREHGLKVVWCVRTGHETDRPIEELKVISRKHPVTGISFRGKKDMCLFAEDLGLRGDHGSTSFFCSVRKRECEYFRNLGSADPDFSGPVSFREILEFGRKEKVCPYYLQKVMSGSCDLLSLNYNYILDPRISAFSSGLFDPGNAILVVDEAHNLRGAYISVNSDRLGPATVKGAEEEARELGVRIPELGRLERFLKNLVNERVVDPDEVPGNGLSDLFLELGSRVRVSRLKEGKVPRSYLYRLGTFLSRLGLTEEEGVFLTGEAGTLELTDARTWRMSEIWEEFHTCIFCSGTLRPVKAFARTVGLKDYREMTVPSFEVRTRTFVLTGVSTRGENLERDMAERYASCLARVKESGLNSAVFFSSYRVMNSVLDICGRKDFLVETPGMGGAEAGELLERFREEGGVLCASTHGRFSEGVDLPGKLDLVFIAGIPFERMNLKTKLFLDYCKKVYGRWRGTYYGYVVPALTRVSQALGRALRGEGDRAVFVLGDERFLEPRIRGLLPGYVEPEPVSWRDFAGGSVDLEVGV